MIRIRGDLIMTTTISSLSDTSQVSLQQSLNQTQSVGVQNIRPERKQNETRDAATGIEHAQSQHTNDQYSHVRYIAREAYVKGSSNEKLASDDEGTYIPQTAVSSSSDSSAKANGTSSDNSSDKASSAQDASSGNDNKKNTTVDGKELTDAEQQQLDELKSRDSEVRQHELAHQSAGGQYASSPSYDYQTGRDGKKYAIGGHVNIDVSEESTPQKTAQKMQQVIQAARAPAEPSGQDLKVASEAQQKLAEAQTQMMQESMQSQSSDDSSESSGDDESSSDQSGAVKESDNKTSGSSSSRSDSSDSQSQAVSSESDSPSQTKSIAPRKTLSENTSITGNDSSATANPSDNGSL